MVKYLPKDLRSWLKSLEDNNLLIRIKKEVDPKTNMGSLCAESPKAIMFENVKGYPGWRVCDGLIKLREQQALLLGTPINKVSSRLAKDLGRPGEVRMVSDGPVKEKILLGDEADLTKLPIITHSKTCGGPYIGSGTIITKDPDTGVRNLACLRLQVKSKHHTGIMYALKHTWMNYQKYEKMDKPMPVAIAIGMHPAYEIATNYSTEYPLDEFRFVEAIMGEPAELLKCETIDMEAPANAEIVIEGEIPPHVREEEGPFAEYTGYSREVLGKALRCIINVKAITMREDAIYRHIQSVRLTDHQSLCTLPMEAQIYNRVKDVGGHVDLKDVYMPPYGSLYMAIIQMVPRFDTEPRSVMLAALSSSYHEPKIIMTVDEDVNIYDPKEIIWSLSTRVDPGKDIILIPAAGSSDSLDISQPVMGEFAGGYFRQRNNIGIDATRPPVIRPMERALFERAVPRGEGEFPLKDFVD